MSVFGSLSGSFAQGAAQGAGRLAGMYAAGNVAKPNFNNLYAQVINSTKNSLEIKDLQNLMKVLNEFEPGLASKVQRRLVKAGRPARNAVAKSFQGVSRSGPLGGPKRPGRRFDKMATNGRLSWAAARSTRNAIDINYKGRTPASFNKVALAKDRTLSVIRIRVRGAAYIMADMGRVGGKAAKLTGQMTRPYQINLFGRGQVTRTHRVNFENVSNWLSRLDVTSDQKRPSRYAYPALEKHSKEYQKNFESILNEIIAETNRKLQS